ncbi:MAG: hypothetical protein M3314_03210, partial [Actinomycetota bacterium]|nr:hypothetical protein [Actinomycetota bacterium]
MTPDASGTTASASMGAVGFRRARRSIRRLTAAILLVASPACTPERGADVTSSPTAPTTQETAAPPLPAPDTTSATLARATTPSCPPIPARRTPDPARPR